MKHSVSTTEQLLSLESDDFSKKYPRRGMLIRISLKLNTELRNCGQRKIEGDVGN